MADILIMGIEMPTEGELLCINIYPDGKVSINLDLNCKQVATAVPVPPHWRLIDADEIEKLVAGYQECAGMHSARAKELCGDSDTVSKYTWAYSQAAIYKRVINDLDTVLSSVPGIVEAEGD